MIELTFLKELMLIRQANQKSATFVTIGIFFNVSNECHDLLMMSMNLSDITISNIKSADYCCIIFGISKGDHNPNAKY